MTIRLFLCLLGLCGATLAGAAPNTQQELETWFNSDADPDAEFKDIREDPRPEFLAKPPAQAVHHHHNTIIIAPQSLVDGWVQLIQCHDHMDAFPSAQIVYGSSRIRKLKISSTRHIGRAWIENGSVQLQDVQAGARLCVEAESQALKKGADGNYLLRNGPYMRKLLDGYFPMRVTVDVKLPNGLQFVSIEPPEQRGLRINVSRRGIHFDAWFEGRLNTEIRLKPAPPAAALD